MEDICTICLISPIPPLNVCTTNCGHRYCKTCLETWQNRINRDCPICREDITYYMYNNSQIRPVFRYVHNDNNIQTLIINNSRLRRSLYITTSVSLTSIFLVLFLYYQEIMDNEELTLNFNNVLHTNICYHILTIVTKPLLNCLS